MKFLRWLVSLFKYGTQKPEVSAESNTPVNPSSPIGEIKKVALIVGHGPADKDKGAESKDSKKNEFDYNSEVAEYIKKSSVHGKQVKVFYRGRTGIVGVAMEAVAWKPDLSIELHLNSFNGIVKGCEVLVLKGDKESGSIAKSFAKSFATKFNRIVRRDEGVNWIDSGDRGAASLKAVSPIKKSILVEPFFIDNDSEYIPPTSYAEWICTWLKNI